MLAARAVNFTLFCLLIAVPLMAKPKPASVPFTTNPDGLVIVRAIVGGTISIDVIFDTSERVDVPLFVIPELSVGPMVKKDALVGSWDVLDKFHFDGIISANDFRRQPCAQVTVH